MQTNTTASPVKPKRVKSGVYAYRGHRIVKCVPDSTYSGPTRTEWLIYKADADGNYTEDDWCGWTWKRSKAEEWVDEWIAERDLLGGRLWSSASGEHRQLQVGDRIKWRWASQCTDGSTFSDYGIGTIVGIGNGGPISLSIRVETLRNHGLSNRRGHWEHTQEAGTQYTLWLQKGHYDAQGRHLGNTYHGYLRILNR